MGFSEIVDVHIIGVARVDVQTNLPSQLHTTFMAKDILSTSNDNDNGGGNSQLAIVHYSNTHLGENCIISIIEQTILPLNWQECEDSDSDQSFPNRSRHTMTTIQQV